MSTKPLPLWIMLAVALQGTVAAAQNTAAGAGPPAVVQPGAAEPHWDLDALGKAPKVHPAEAPLAKDVRSLFYEGPRFQQRFTRVFAYYGAPKLPAGVKAPGMVLVHGGGGTAFDAWVRLWNGRGYAAIAMDLCGCVPIGSYGKWKRHDAGGPPGWGGFDQIDWPLEDQWTYQAVADVLLAHSLLRSFPEVDAERIGVTGISWGGYLTCLVAGVDPRFRFAAPVYGCGFLGDNSCWLPQFAKMGPEKAGRWLRWWDPSAYLRRAKMPMLWVTGTNDFAYPMDSLQKSYRSAPGPRTLCLRVRMPHGHGGAGENPAEIHAFAESVLNQGLPLPKITGQGREGEQVWAAFESRSPIKKAELHFTCQTGKWQDRTWETTEARVDQGRGRVTAKLPPRTRVYYLNLIDQRDLVVSTEHEEILDAAPPAQPKRVLLLGQTRDHPPGTHEYLSGLHVLARCLQGVAGVEAKILNVDGDWPEGPELIRAADGLVLYLGEGGRWMQAEPKRSEAIAALAARGGGIVGIHWAIGAKDARYVPGHLKWMGGMHGGPDRKYTFTTTDLTLVAPHHPIARGLEPFRLKDEFYYQLKFAKEGTVIPLVSAAIGGTPETCAWAFERPDGGRSFGFCGMHDHINWGLASCRRLIAQGVLWTLNVPIPEKGLPVDVAEEDLAIRPSPK